MKTKTLQVRLPLYLYNRIELYSHENKKTVSKVIRDHLEESFNLFKLTDYET